MPVLHLFQLLGQSVQNIRSGPSVSARASSIAVKEVFVFIFCIYSVDMYLHLVLCCMYVFELFMYVLFYALWPF